MTNLHRICARSPRTGRVSLGMGAVVASLLLLSACSEPEVILPGLREDVRAVLQSDDGFDAPTDLAAPENTSRAISLPAKQCQLAPSRRHAQHPHQPRGIVCRTAIGMVCQHRQRRQPKATH